VITEQKPAALQVFSWTAKGTFVCA